MRKFDKELSASARKALAGQFGVRSAKSALLHVTDTSLRHIPNLGWITYREICFWLQKNREKRDELIERGLWTNGLPMWIAQEIRKAGFKNKQEVTDALFLRGLGGALENSTQEIADWLGIDDVPLPELSMPPAKRVLARALYIVKRAGYSVKKNDRR